MEVLCCTCSDKDSLNPTALLPWLCPIMLRFVLVWCTDSSDEKPGSNGSVAAASGCLLTSRYKLRSMLKPRLVQLGRCGCKIRKGEFGRTAAPPSATPLQQTRPQGWKNDEQTHLLAWCTRELLPNKLNSCTKKR